MNLAEIFEKTVQRFSQNIALVFQGKEYSYADLESGINKLANGLGKKGMNLGDRLAVLLPNSPEGVFSFYAGLKLGAVSIMLNPMLKGRELKAILVDSRAKAFITHRQVYDSIRAEKDGPEFLSQVVLTNRPGDDEATLSFQKLIKDDSNRFNAVSVEDEAPAVIIYTSGTTGAPKGAVFNHGALRVGMKASSRAIVEMAPGDKVLNVAPLSSSMGVVCLLLQAFLSGVTVYLLERFNPEEYVKIIHEQEISVIQCVPTILVALNSMPGVGARDLKSLRFVGCSGAPLPQEVRLEFEHKFNQKIIQYYGATESTRVLAADPASGERRLESVGRPVYDVKVKILDPSGGEAPAGQPGEICVQMPGGMTGYWGRPAETAEALKNGWLHTGDIGKLDQDGFLYLLDRKKDMMIVSGYNVFPTEIENVLHEDSRILEVAVIGIPDERSGEKPMAFVILKKGQLADEEEIISLTREKLAVYKTLKKVKFVDSLPKSPIGKVLKKFLRQQYLSELETGKSG